MYCARVRLQGEEARQEVVMKSHMIRDKGRNRAEAVTTAPVADTVPQFSKALELDGVVQPWQPV